MYLQTAKTRSAMVLLAASLTFILTACGPIYETRYTFVPPESDQGRACIFQCENGKLQCEQLEEMRNERCEDRADREYNRCQDRGEKYCYREYCSVDYSNCEARYRGCYQSCGGKVQSEQVCVGFCEQKR